MSSKNWSLGRSAKHAPALQREAELAVGCGVVALPAEGGFELDGCDEEGAGFADRFEVAVDLDGSGAVAVAEHASVHLGTELAHLGALGVGGEGSSKAARTQLHELQGTPSPSLPLVQPSDVFHDDMLLRE